MMKLFNHVLPHNFNKETVILAMIALMLPTPGVLEKGVTLITVLVFMSPVPVLKDIR